MADRELITVIEGPKGRAEVYEVSEGGSHDVGHVRRHVLQLRGRHGQHHRDGHDPR